MNIIKMSTLPYNFANNWAITLSKISNNPGGSLSIDASGNNQINLTNNSNNVLTIADTISTFSGNVTINNPYTTNNGLVINNNSANISSPFAQLQIKNTSSSNTTQLNYFCDSSFVNVFNGVIGNYDAGIIYTSNGSVTTSNAGFVICPNLGSSVSKGLRMDQNGNVNILGNLTAGSYGFNAPNVSILTSGTSYIPPLNAIYLRVKMIGGGGGGGGAAGSSGQGGDGGSGGSTAFGSLTCNGGSGGTSISGGAGGAGGSTPTITPSATLVSVVNIPGAKGSSTLINSPGSFYQIGGVGASSPFGGGGGCMGGGGGGGNGVSYGTGGGGAGIWSNSTGPPYNYNGGGGGAGGYVEVLIFPPYSSSYAYSIGGGGTGGSSGGSPVVPSAGGTGGPGVVIVTAYFQ
jgi:hypothetical protein